MPSLFSRSRTQSSPSKQPTLSTNGHGTDHHLPPLDEFGRVSSRQSIGKKDKEKTKKSKPDHELTRTRTANANRDSDYGSPLSPSLPEGTFLPLHLERPRDEFGKERPKEHDYGYLSFERHIILGPEQAERLVVVVVEELRKRGLTTPFIFSNLALDVNSSAIRRLIRAFLATCADPQSAEAQNDWLKEARFAEPHELGMCLRWGLARVVRIVGGQEIRGLVPWDIYQDFCDTEAGKRFFSSP